MAFYERQFQRVTREQLIKCIRWCQNKLNLRDWHIEFIIGSQDPKESLFGSCSIERRHNKIAEIWVDVEKNKKANFNPYRATCHELIHVLTLGVCGIEDNERDEPIAYAFEDLLYQKFCEENNIKIAPYLSITDFLKITKDKK